MKKLIAITGASSGFGKEMALYFHHLGYPLLLMARRINRLKELNLENAYCAEVDVNDLEQIEAAIEEAEKLYGPIDLFINNAGIMLLGDLDTQDPKEWKEMMNTNIMGTLNGMKSVLPKMKQRQHGTVINFSSIAGRKSFPQHAAYCASKYGIMGLSEVAREELAPYNVRIMTICPGAVQTELLSHTTDNKIKENYQQWLQETQVTQIQPQDIAKTVCFMYEMPQGVNLREVHISDTRQDS